MKQTDSIQDIWDKFDRWIIRYRKVCYNEAEEMSDRMYSASTSEELFNEGLFVKTWAELASYSDETFDIDLIGGDLSERITAKINCLRDYLAYISFDGPDFMAQKSNFLTQQYPSRCNNNIGIWLEQDLEGDIEAGCGLRFQGFEVSIFCKKIEDIDLESMREILPFDRMYVRNPKGITWDKKSADTIVKQIQEDIEYGHEVSITYDVNDLDGFISMGFIWN